MTEDSGITVLLIDDDDLIRECVTAYLEDEGFCVHSATSGEAGLSIIGGLSPSACITDLRLPGMSGEEFIVRANAVCPDSIFLLHTGMIVPLSEELRSVGMQYDDILLKPVHDLAQLANRIRRFADRGGKE